MGARCGDSQRGTTINIWARGNTVSRQMGHSYTLYRMLWRHEGGNRDPTKGEDAALGGGTLQENPRSGWATEGSRHWLQQRSVQILNYLATILHTYYIYSSTSPLLHAFLIQYSTSSLLQTYWIHCISTSRIHSTYTVEPLPCAYTALQYM